MSKYCWRRNETPTLQSGLNLCILTLASYSCFILYPLHNNLQGKLPSTIISRLYSAQAQGEITFTLTYLLQLRLCFGELPYQLRIRFVPRSVPIEESEKHPCVQCNVLFPREQTGFLVEHLVCKNVQPWLRVSSASTSQPSLYLVPYTGQNISFARMFSPG